MSNGIRAAAIATAYLAVYIVLIDVKASENSITSGNICTATCYSIMEPFEIEIDTNGISKTLMVYTNPIDGSYDIFEDKHRLGVIYRDQEKGGIWCSKHHLPIELINLMGARIDAYES